MDQAQLSRPANIIWNIVDDVLRGVCNSGLQRHAIRLFAVEKVKFDETAEALLTEMTKGTAA